MSLSAHQRPHRGKTDEWLTPPEIIKALGPFDLDPCAAVIQPWPTAARQYTIEDNGLAQEWKGYVWCNPPFGPEAKTWLRRMAAHGNGIALAQRKLHTSGLKGSCVDLWRTVESFDESEPQQVMEEAW